MGRDSKISWTHHTFNPWRGCSKVSPGCTHCYAEALSHRNPAVLGVWGPGGTRVVAGESMWREPLKWARDAEKAGERHRVFCASLADVFEDRPELDGPRVRLFGLIRATPSLDWLLLTKRPENWWPIVKRIWRAENDLIGPHRDQDWCMWTAGWLDGDAPPNVWVGVSVEDQARADERIPPLLEVPAAVRFLSCEPLLGPLDLDAIGVGDQRGLNALSGEFCYYRESDGEPRSLWGPGIDWVIVGGESGPGARPCDLAWVRSIRDQCEAAGVACFVKQLGARPFGNFGEPNPPVGRRHMPVATRQELMACSFINFRDPKGGDPDEFPADLRIREFPGARHA